MSAEGGLRERKNERTRVAIETAAIELAMEQGYERTTVDQIAARADVSPRTVYSRYATKDEIVLGGDKAATADFKAWLAGPAATMVERLESFLRARVVANRDHGDLERRRMRAILADPHLRPILRGRLDRAEALIADRLAADLALPADDAGPRVFAAAVSGLFLSMAEQGLAHPDCFDAAADCENGLAFLSAGLAALSARAGAPT